MQQQLDSAAQQEFLQDDCHRLVVKNRRLSLSDRAPRVQIRDDLRKHLTQRRRTWLPSQKLDTPPEVNIPPVTAKRSTKITLAPERAAAAAAQTPAIPPPITATSAW